VKTKFCFAITIVSFLFACQGKQPPSASLRLFSAHETVFSRMLHQRFLAEQSTRSVVRGLAEMTWRDSHGTRTSDVALHLQLPHDLTAEAFDALADVWAKIRTDGKKFFFEVLTDRGKRRGKTTERHLAKFFSFEWETEEFVAALAGTLPFLTSDIFLEENRSLFHFQQRPFTFRIDQKGRVLSYRRGDESGTKTLYEVHFSDYRLHGKTFFPYRVVIKLQERELSLRYREVKFNEDEKSF